MSRKLIKFTGILYRSTLKQVMQHKLPKIFSFDVSHQDVRQQSVTQSSSTTGINDWHYISITSTLTRNGEEESEWWQTKAKFN